MWIASPLSPCENNDDDVREAVGCELGGQHRMRVRRKERASPSTRGGGNGRGDDDEPRGNAAGRGPLPSSFDDQI